MSDRKPTHTALGASASRIGADLAPRALSSLVLAAVAILVTWYGGWPFALFWLAAGMAVSVEWLAMTRAEPFAPLATVSLLALAVLLLCSRTLPPFWGALAGVVSGLVLCWVAASTRHRLWALAGLICASVIALAMPLLRDEIPYGPVLVAWMFAVVWGSDIAAYFAGRLLGGPKLWPAVSPGKTWSGAIVGLAAGTLAGLLAVTAVCRWAGLPAPFGPLAILLGSAIASVAGQFGDLAESALKRSAGVKDSGRLIPGHGGVMDRIDALWAVALLAGCGLAGARFGQP